VLNIRESYSQKCQICHRDDTDKLEVLNTEKEDAKLACPTCRTMDEIGKELLRVKYIVRSSSESNIKINDKSSIDINGTCYHVLQEGNFKNFDQSDALYLVNNWELKNHQFAKFTPFVIGNYAKESEEEPGKIIRVGELARNANGTDRVGYLRMDVDNLGRIFSEGLDDEYNLPRLASLSRQLSYFFTVYLNKLAEAQEQQGKNLVFIYAGGDDLFICGSWNELVDFSFEIYNSFRSYTGYNPYITLSGGICLGDIKFPSYQAAFKSGEAEEKGKGNGKDSLGLFGEVFKWGEWLGEIEVTKNFDPETVKYLEPEPMIEPFGVLPLVELLNSSKIPYSRSFIRNLLITAELQEQKIKEAQDKKEPYMDLRYYLHLPKIAYTLARLPQSTRQTDDYNKLSKSLKSPHNAPYFRAIATWIELLNRKPNESKTND
jgi:CRISPR-associated protein Csm1